MKLSCAGSSDSFNLIRACAPQNSGTRRPGSIRYLGELPEVTAGFSDITAIYTAKFGVPAVGDRIFVQSNQMESRLSGPPESLFRAGAGELVAANAPVIFHVACGS